jgi:hypothetical protein
MPSPTIYNQTTLAVPMQIEGRAESHTLHLRGQVDGSGYANVLSGAGVAAILATLSTYYSGLSAAKMATITAASNGQFLNVTTANSTVAVHAADHATVGASLATNVKAAGNLTHG